MFSKADEPRDLDKRHMRRPPDPCAAPLTRLGAQSPTTTPDGLGALRALRDAATAASRALGRTASKLQAATAAHEAAESASCLAANELHRALAQALADRRSEPELAGHLYGGMGAAEMARELGLLDGPDADDWASWIVAMLPGDLAKRHIVAGS